MDITKPYLLHEIDHSVFGHIDHALVTGLVNGPLMQIEIVEFGLKTDKKKKTFATKTTYKG